MRGVIDTQGDGGFMADPSAVDGVEFVTEPVAVGEAFIGGANRVPVKRGRVAGEVRLCAYVFERPLRLACRSATSSWGERQRGSNCVLAI